MKIILEAFQGRMRSSPMDIPDNQIGRDFYMVLDMDRLEVPRTANDMAEFRQRPTKCRFVPSGGHVPINKPGNDIPMETAEVYTLVGF